jgi:hypothetical protein
MSGSIFPNAAAVIRPAPHPRGKTVEKTEKQVNNSGKPIRFSQGTTSVVNLM